jgi:hypothetical protein
MDKERQPRCRCNPPPSISSFVIPSMLRSNDGWQDLMVTGDAIRNVGDIAGDYLGLDHRAEKALAQSPELRR